MALGFLEAKKLKLQGLGLWRAPSAPTLTGVDVSSNDYLGYARRPVSRETAADLLQAPAGSGASRLIHGTTPDHAALEMELADWVGSESALLFSSGYAANVGLITALAGPGDVVLSDSLNHASIIDACRLSRAKIVVTPHLDIDATRRALVEHSSADHRWVVTESYFSMDADCPDLRALRKLCDDHDAALLVDEAHALGIHGPGGAGVCKRQQVMPDALVGTLGKAVGVHGAFVAGPQLLRDWLWNSARSFVFSTATSPLVARLCLANVKMARGDDDARARLERAHARLIAELRARNVPLRDNLEVGPIVPINIGDNDRVIRIARQLGELGFRAQAIRPPTVPPGTARLRITLHADLTDDEITNLANALAQTCSA